jgi:hypothetical protein
MPIRQHAGVGGPAGNEWSVAGILNELGPDILVDLTLRDGQQVVVLGY